METQRVVDIKEKTIDQLQAMAYREIRKADLAHKNLAAIERAIQAKEAAHVKKAEKDAQGDLAPQPERTADDSGDDPAVAHSAEAQG